jgi:hypothetical protein
MRAISMVTLALAMVLTFAVATQLWAPSESHSRTLPQHVVP